MPSLRDRLPPGQYVTSTLPVHLTSSVPHFDPAAWDLRVFGLVEAPLALTWMEYQALPRSERRSDVHDVSTWSVLDSLWGGVLAREVLARVRLLPEARFVLLHCDGGFTTNLPLDDLRRDDVILAESRNGAPLPPEHGYPVRLVVPHRYAWKSARWLRAIEVLAEEQKGFYESRGYSNTADPWKDDRFAVE